MKELILMASYWIHLIATVIWVGGIVFILFIAIPSARHVLGAEAGKVMGEISKRFTPLTNYSIVLLVITGVVLAGLSKEFHVIRALENRWTITLVLKLISVFIMISIHFYRGLVLAPKIGRTVSEAEKTALQKLSLNLVKVNFALGLAVLLLSGTISVFRGY